MIYLINKRPPHAKVRELAEPGQSFQSTQRPNPGQARTRWTRPGWCHRCPGWKWSFCRLIFSFFWRWKDYRISWPPANVQQGGASRRSNQSSVGSSIGRENMEVKFFPLNYETKKIGMLMPGHWKLRRGDQPGICSHIVDINSCLEYVANNKKCSLDLFRHALACTVHATPAHWSPRQRPPRFSRRSALPWHRLEHGRKTMWATSKLKVCSHKAISQV